MRKHLFRGKTPSGNVVSGHFGMKSRIDPENNELGWVPVVGEEEIDGSTLEAFVSDHPIHGEVWEGDRFAFHSIDPIIYVVTWNEKNANYTLYSGEYGEHYAYSWLDKMVRV